ncbi:hypothetical protein BH11PAT1_BH11PAT1_7040 [soil metagenome]
MVMVISLILFLLPLVALPFFSLGFETPKVLLFESCVIFFFAYGFVKNNLHFSTPLRIFLLGGVILSITTLVFSYSSTVLFNNPIRMQGLFLQGIFFLWVIISVASSLTFRFLPFVSLGILSLSSIFLVDLTTGRAVGLLGEPNSLGGVAVILFVCAFFALSKQKGKWLYQSAGAICCLLTIFLSGSRSALLAFLLACLLIFVMVFKKTAYRAATGISLLFLCLTLSLPFFNTNDSWENRIQVWQTALVAGWSRPVFGNGIGNTTASLKLASQRLQNPIQYQYVDSSHNIMLDWWVQGGVLGLGILLYAFVISFQTFIQKQMLREFILLWTLIIILSFNPVSVSILAIFWWCIGRGFSQKTERM